MKLRYLEDVANVKALEVVEQPTSTAEFLIRQGLAERVEEVEITEVYSGQSPDPVRVDVEPTQPAPVKRRPGRPRKNPQ